MKKSVKIICAFLVIVMLAIPLIGCAKPLSLTITAPTDRRTIDKSQVEVRATVTDAKATVWVNDSIVEIQKFRSGGGYITTMLDLSEGDNTIKVTAAKGKPGQWKDVVERTVMITYTPAQASVKP